MVEDIDPVMEHNDRLNRRNWRRWKSVIKWRAKNLIPNVTYAMGCRGHPGLVVKRTWHPAWFYRDLWGADVTIRSLVDGIEENCSLANCAPMPITKQEAEERLHEIHTLHDADIAVKRGHTIEETKEWIKYWIDQGVLYYVLNEQKGFTVRSNQAFTKEEAEAEVKDINERIADGRWKDISNPRIVDMLTYPAPIQSFDVDTLRVPA